MFTQRFVDVFKITVRIGLVVFFAITSVHLLLEILQGQAIAQQSNTFVLPEQTLSFALSSWKNECLPQKTIVSGIGLGDATQLINPQTLNWKHEGELLTLQAQMAGVITDEPLPDAVLLATDAPQQITVTEAVTNERAYVFSTALAPASIMTSTILYAPVGHETAVPQLPSPDNGIPVLGSSPRGLVLYGEMAQSELWTSVGQLTLASVLSQRDVVDTAQELLTFAPLVAETDLMVTAVYIDNNPDDKAIVVEAAAGGVTTAVTETTPTHGNILNITTLTLTAVPTGTIQLTLTIKSPPSPNGDSATLIGLNMNYRCANNGDDPNSTFAFYLPIIYKPANMAITATQSQTPALTGIPFNYFISVTNISNRDIPQFVIQDLFPIDNQKEPYVELMIVEKVSPSDGCIGYGEIPPDTPLYDGQTVLCRYDTLAVGETKNLTVTVRPNVAAPTNFEAKFIAYSLIPGLKLSNNIGAVQTQIDQCLQIGAYETYVPFLLFNETYCGQTGDQADVPYYFTFVLTRPGRVTATLKPAQADPALIDSSINYPSLVQLAFRSADESKNLTWCCEKRMNSVVISYTYSDIGEKHLMVYAIENFPFTYTLTLEQTPLINGNTLTLPEEDADNFMGTILPGKIGLARQPEKSQNLPPFLLALSIIVLGLGFRIKACFPAA